MLERMAASKKYGQRFKKDRGALCEAVSRDATVRQDFLDGREVWIQARKDRLGLVLFGYVTVIVGRGSMWLHAVCRPSCRMPRPPPPLTLQQDEFAGLGRRRLRGDFIGKPQTTVQKDVESNIRLRGPSLDLIPEKLLKQWIKDRNMSMAVLQKLPLVTIPRARGESIKGLLVHATSWQVPLGCWRVPGAYFSCAVVHSGMCGPSCVRAARAGMPPCHHLVVCYGYALPSLCLCC